MGKILFVADIHGNMPAVEALEKEIERLQPDDIWFLGMQWEKVRRGIKRWIGYAVIVSIS